MNNYDIFYKYKYLKYKKRYIELKKNIYLQNSGTIVKHNTSSKSSHTKSEDKPLYIIYINQYIVQTTDPKYNDNIKIKNFFLKEIQKLYINYIDNISTNLDDINYFNNQAFFQHIEIQNFDIKSNAFNTILENRIGDKEILIIIDFDNDFSEKLNVTSLLSQFNNYKNNYKLFIFSNNILYTKIKQNRELQVMIPNSILMCNTDNTDNKRSLNYFINLINERTINSLAFNNYDKDINQFNIETKFDKYKFELFIIPTEKTKSSSWPISLFFKNYKISSQTIRTINEYNDNKKKEEEKKKKEEENKKLKETLIRNTKYLPFSKSIINYSFK